MSDILDKSLSVAASIKALQSGAASAVELTHTALELAKECKLEINAFSKLDRRRALATAEKCDHRYKTRQARPLEGVPIAVKDMIDTAGLETRYGSRAYSGNIPNADADIVRILREAGAIIIGKTTTHEFAWGVTTASDSFGPTLNPHNPKRIPGGSSGGMAAAISYGAVSAGLGTDTGGSVRIPAALCGTVGFKPSFGRMPIHGIFPLSRSLDHPGILGAGVADVTALAAPFGIKPEDEPANIRIGVISELPGMPVDHSVAEAFERALTTLRGLATIVEPVADLSIFDGLFEAFADTILIEAGVEHSALHDLDFIERTYNCETASRIELAQSKMVGELTSARRRSWQFRSQLEDLFETYDVLVLPTCPCEAPRIGLDELTIGDWHGSTRQALMAYTSPFNLAGVPAISVPIGMGAKAGLPVGMQIVAPFGQDNMLLSFAAAIEQAQSSSESDT